jgi:hypothetical protein
MSNRRRASYNISINRRQHLLTLAVYIMSGILLGSLAFWVAEATDERDSEKSNHLDYTNPDLIIPPRADDQE